MKTVGITGGIGSGKTMVCKVLEALSVPVFYADAAAKDLMAPTGLLAQPLQEIFGPQLYAQGRLNRSWLANQVFSNPDLLAQLNALVHPATVAAWHGWKAAQNATYVVKEAAIFFESGTAGDVDLMVMVDAPQPLRLLRAMRRDGSSRDQVLERMSKQLDAAILRKLCDRLLLNDDLRPLLPQILALDAALRRG